MTKTSHPLMQDWKETSNVIFHGISQTYLLVRHGMQQCNFQYMHWITKKDIDSVPQLKISSDRIDIVTDTYFERNKGFGVLLLMTMVFEPKILMTLLMFVWTIYHSFSHFVEVSTKMTGDLYGFDYILGEGCEMSLSDSFCLWFCEFEWIGTPSFGLFSTQNVMPSANPCSHLNLWCSSLTRTLTMGTSSLTPSGKISSMQNKAPKNSLAFDNELGEGAIANLVQHNGYIRFLCKVLGRFIRRMLKG